MQSEKAFEQAVQLAAAFVSNGDIRLGTDQRSRQRALDLLAELIPALLDSVDRAREQVAAGGQPPSHS